MPKSRAASRWWLLEGWSLADTVGPEQVIARSRCRFRRVPEPPPGLGAKDRQDFLQVQLQAWTPFQHTQCAVAADGQGWMVFAWDGDGADAAAGGHPPVPETLLLPRGNEGARLLACREGVEGQLWKAGNLLASRWWPTPPGAAEWANFMRGAGSQEAMPLPSMTEAQPSQVPWAAVETPQSLAERRRVRGHMLVAAVALLLALPTVWLGADWWRTQSQVEQLRAQVDAMDSALQPVFRLRAETLQAQADLARLQPALQRPEAAALLAHLAEIWPRDGSSLQELSWRGQELRLSARVNPSTPRVAYVQALERGQWLQGIREEAREREAGLLTLVARLGDSGPPQAAAFSEPGGAASPKAP